MEPWIGTIFAKICAELLMSIPNLRLTKTQGEAKWPLTSHHIYVPKLKIIIAKALIATVINET